jgi:hypothetical protein
MCLAITVFIEKMAGVEYYCSFVASDSGVSCAQNPVCNFCSGYLSEIASLNTEIQSARKIIQLLQDDLNGIKDQPPWWERSITHANDAPNNWNNWKTKAARTRISNPGNRRCLTRNTLLNQKPIPVIQTSNRFHVLHNLQTVQKEASHAFERTPNIQRRINQTLKKKPVNSLTRIKPLKKITSIGDSHIRGLAAELRNLMGREYPISSTFMPGAGLQSITKLAKSEIVTFTKSYIVVVCGGSNDACKNESQTDLNCLNNFSNSTASTSIMIISIPQRLDLSSESCVNKEILSFNRKLHKLMKNKELVKVLDCTIPRDGFTRHGQHHSNKGKAMLALQIMH